MPKNTYKQQQKYQAHLNTKNKSMKLYATINSERASKSQGGNDYIEITINDQNKITICSLIITTNGLINLGTFKEYSKNKYFEHLFKMPQTTKSQKAKNGKIHSHDWNYLSDNVRECKDKKCGELNRY